MTMYWLLWGWDALIALVFVVFFFWGLADGSVSQFNILLWIGVLAALGAVLGGSSWLRNAGHRRVAQLVLLSLAIPGFLVALFFLVLIIAQPRWN
jgi:hypothetical protein